MIEAVSVGYMIHPYGISAFAEQINFARKDSFYISAFLIAIISILSQKRMVYLRLFSLNISLEDKHKQKRRITFSL